MTMQNPSVIKIKIPQGKENEFRKAVRPFLRPSLPTSTWEFGTATNPEYLDENDPSNHDKNFISFRYSRPTAPESAVIGLERSEGDTFRSNINPIGHKEHKAILRDFYETVLLPIQSSFSSSIDLGPMIPVSIPTPLRPLTDNLDTVEVEGATVSELLTALDKKYAGIGERLLDAQGNVRRFVNIYVNGEDIRFLQDKETPVKSGDEVSIVPAIAGG
jgi:molybdopterin synthase sulfur carrier subunit